MDRVVVSDDEWAILQGYKHQAPYRLMRLKSEAVVLLSKDVDTAVVAQVVERTPETVRSWARAWNRYRLASIHTGHAGNLNASRLTATQRQEVAGVLSRPPSEQGLPIGFWDVPHLVAWVYDHFEVEYASAASYRFLLHMAGLSFHRPEAVDQRRPPQADVDQRMSQIRSEIVRKWSDPEVMVVCADEVRIEHEAIVRRAWIRRGDAARLEVDRRRQAQSYIGFLHETDGTVDLMTLDWQDTGTITQALIDLTVKHPDKKKIVIVWDNASWHRSAKLRHSLKTIKNLERIHLINLPAYSPDENPIEHVWKEAKDSISNHQRATFPQTRQAFATFIQANKFPYRLTK